MNSSQISPLTNNLRVLYEMEHRIIECLKPMVEIVRNRHARAALQLRMEELKGHVQQLQEVFSSLGIEPSRKNPEKQVEQLFRALDQQLKTHTGAADFDDTVLHTLGRISQIQVRQYAQATVLALEMQSPLLAAGLQDMLDDYSAFTRRLSKNMLTQPGTGSPRGKIELQRDCEPWGAPCVMA